MNRLLLTLIWLLPAMITQAQKIKDVITLDTVVYVFKLDYEQSKFVQKKKTIPDTSFLFTKKYKEYSHNHFKPDSLREGTYISAAINDHQLTYSFFVNTPFLISSKVMKDEVYIYLTRKKDKKLIQQAKLELDGLAIPYDPSIGGYSVLKSKLNQKRIDKREAFLKISYDAEVYAFEFQLNKYPEPAPPQNYYDNRYTVLNSPGYFILDKPLYKPLDSLRMKAFIVDFKNGRPLRRRMHLTISEPNQNFVYKTTIKRKSPGAYVFNWKIPDTLKIDRNFELNMRYEKNGRKFIKQSFFKLEEYELAKNTFEVNMPELNFFAGDDVVFYTTAKDRNGFPVQGTKLYYNLRILNIMNLLTDTLSISKAKHQNWYEHDTIMEYENSIECRIPSGIFPKANAQYQLEVTFTDPITFEKKTQQYTFTKYSQAEKVLFYQAEDSVHVRTLVNGKDSIRPYSIIVMRGSDTIMVKKIKSRFSMQVPEQTTQVVLVGKDSSLKVIQFTYNKLNMMRVKGKRSGDSIRISFAYPFPEPVHYRIYKKNTVVKKGESNTIEFVALDNSLDEYRLELTQNLQQGIENNFYEFKFVPEKNKLHFETNIPKQALPGDSLAIELTVKDFKNRVRKKVNVAAYAMNSAFENNIQPPIIDVPVEYQNRVEINPMPAKGIANFLYQPYSSTYFLQNPHFTRFNLWKNEYYQLRYPEKEVTILKTKKQQKQPEFALFITHKHTMYCPKYILVDGEPIFIYDINKVKQYSFSISEGKHTIAFRFMNKLFEWKDLQFSANTKYHLGTNMDSIKKNSVFNITDSLPILEPSAKEKELLYSSLLLTNVFGSDSLKIESKDLNSAKSYYGVNIQLPMLNIDGDSYLVQGPFKKKELITLNINGKRHTLQPGVETVYHFDPIQNDFVPKPLGKIKGAFLPFVEQNLPSYHLSQLIQPDTLVPEPLKAVMQYKPLVLEAQRNKEDDEEQLYQGYNGPQQGKYFSIWVENNSPNKFVKSLWTVSKTQFESASYIPNFPRSIYSYIKYNAEQKYDIYLFFNKNRMAILNGQQYNQGDVLYINPSYVKTMPFSKEAIETPLKIFNELNAVPLLPFYDEPLQASERIKVKEGKRNNTYFHGMITNESQRPLADALVYVEMNGVFKYGAKTNRNGLFEILDMLPATYQVKVYHPEHKISHYKPWLFEAGKELELNATLIPREISAPLFETIHSDFRMMAFANHEKDNKLRIVVHDKETRVALNNYSILIYRKNILVTTIQGNQTVYEILFYTDKENEYSMEIRKDDYTTLRLNKIYFRSHYHYLLEVYLGTEKKEILKLKEYNVWMENLQNLNKQINTNNRAVTINDMGFVENALIEGQVLNENGEPLEYATVQVLTKGVVKAGAKTDATGHYRIDGISPGNYNLKVSYLGYQSMEVKDIQVAKNKHLLIDVRLTQGNKDKLQEVVITTKKTTAYNEGKRSLDAESIQYAPSINSADMVSYSSPTTYQSRLGDATMSIAANQASGTMYMIDGIQVRGTREVLISQESEDKDESSSSQPKRDYADANMLQQAMENKNASTIRKLFTDVGFWKPNLVTNKQGRVAFSIKLPDNITSWKTYLVAMGRRWMYGTDSQLIKVYKPLQTIVTAPNYLYKLDTLEAKIKYQNLMKDPVSVVVQSKLNERSLFNKEVEIVNTYMDSCLVQGIGDTVDFEAGLTYMLRYKDAEQYRIPVLSTAMHFNTNQQILMEEDKTYNLELEPNTKGEIIFNNTLLESILSVIEEVGKYEYGCVEQTASKLYALLLKESILKKLNQSKKADKEIKILLAQLADKQNLDGSFGWWKNDGAYDRMTIYAMEIAFRAINAGYSNTVYNPAYEYVTHHFNEMSVSDQLYAFYTLSLNGSVNAGIKDKLQQVRPEYLSTTDKIYYYHFRRMQNLPVNEQDMYAVFLELNQNSMRPYYDNFFYDYRADVFKAYALFRGSSFENQFLNLFKSKLRNGQLARGLNTFSKVAMIEALTNSTYGDTSKPIASTITINNEQVIKKFPARVSIEKSKYTIQHIGGEVFLNTSELHSTENPERRDTNYAVRTYIEQGGISKSRLKAGEMSVMKIDVQAFKKGDHVMVEVPIPSGMKIRNKQTNYGKGEYVEYFKHKVVFYFEHLPMGMRQLQLDLMPVFKGNFVVPATKVSLMYYPYIFGNNENMKLRIE